MPIYSKKFHDETLADRRLLHTFVNANGNVAAAISAIQNGISKINSKLDEMSPASSNTIWQVVKRGDVTFFLDSRSLVDKCIIETGAWEEDQVEYLNKTIKSLGNCSDFYFFDIGSYFGYYSMLVKKNFPNSRIFTFEANPMTYVQLKANLLCNNLHDKVTALNVVVCSTPGKTTVSDHEDLLDNRGGWSVGGAESASSRMIDNLVPDEYFANLENQFIVMKIDVEGYEAEVLQGLGKVLAKNRVFLQVECFDFDTGLREKFEQAIAGLGLRKIHQIQYDHYYVNFGDDSLVEPPQSIHMPASKFFTGNVRTEEGYIAFDRSIVGHIIYGPCMWVPQGRRRVVFRFTPGTVLDNCAVEVFSNYAHARGENAIFHSEDVNAANYEQDLGELTISYEHPLAYCDIEFRLLTKGQAEGTFMSVDIHPL